MTRYGLTQQEFAKVAAHARWFEARRRAAEPSPTTRSRAKFLKSGLLQQEYALCAVPRTAADWARQFAAYLQWTLPKPQLPLPGLGHRLAPVGSTFVPSRWQAIRRGRNLSRSDWAHHYNLPPLKSWDADPLCQLIGQQRVVVSGKEGYVGFGKIKRLAVYTESIYSGSSLPTPKAKHPAGLDARPYLEALPRPTRRVVTTATDGAHIERKGDRRYVERPLCNLHELVGQPLAIPVRVTRAEATDVVPLPAGIRGRWEGWTVEQPVPRRCPICRESIKHLRPDATVCRKKRCRVADWRLRTKATPARRAA